MSTIGLIAGGGRFPILFADSARRAGHRVVAVAHRSETDPSLVEHVDALSWVKVGQLGRLVAALKDGGAEGTVMLGAITKARLFRDAWPDLAGLEVMAQVAVRSDDNLLRAVARHLEEQGLPIVDPAPFLQDRLAPEGVLGKHQPSEDEMADARYGMDLARGIGRLDLGQTVVVKRCVALAVEAMEGRRHLSGAARHPLHLLQPETEIGRDLSGARRTIRAGAPNHDSSPHALPGGALFRSRSPTVAADAACALAVSFREPRFGGVSAEGVRGGKSSDGDGVVRPPPTSRT